MTPGTTMWEHISHGFQASTMMQYHSSLPFNIVSGVNSLQTTADGRLRMDRCRHRTSTSARWSSSRGMPARVATFYVEPASQPFVSARRRQPHRGPGRSVQSDRSGEYNHAQQHLRPGLVSVESNAVVQHGDGGRRSENHPIRRAVHLLTSCSGGTAFTSRRRPVKSARKSEGTAHSGTNRSTTSNRQPYGRRLC